MTSLLGVPLALVLGALLCLALGAGAAVLISRRRPAPPPSAVSVVLPDSVLGGQVVEVLSAGIVVLDNADEVALSNPAARVLGVVREGRLAHPALRTAVRQARRSGEPSDREWELPRDRGLEPLAVRVQAASLGPTGHVALEVSDMTEAHRLAKVRRDFVANVSHELKTPVGALALLGEAMLDATDDPEAVSRFARRMQHESSRLGRLVQELIDLSRLQGGDPLPDPDMVLVDAVVAEVLDRSRTAADTRGITVVSGGDTGLTVHGNEQQLVTALSNLVDNAIAYSPQRTRVAIGVRRRDGLVELSVSDQGIGIAETDLDRIFERFYRADPARSRATGGTGLGLAIVKHIATNHGGSVDVWSVEGSGSTFTLRLPTGSSLPLVKGIA